jgi:hypothetical protein
MTYQVRCMKDEYELNVVKLEYSSYGGSQTLVRQGGGLQKNTIIFRRVRGGRCCEDINLGKKEEFCACQGGSKKCLLHVMQRATIEFQTKAVQVGDADRLTVEVDWDVLHDESFLNIFSGQGCDACQEDDSNCKFCSDDDKQENGSDEGSSDRVRQATRCLRACRMFCLGFKTQNGLLGLDTDSLNRRFNPSTTDATAKGNLEKEELFSTEMFGF